VDTTQFEKDTNAQVVHAESPMVDTTSFVAMLKPGLDNVNVTRGNEVAFVARKGQLILYSGNGWGVVADGRDGLINPNVLVRVDTPCFKFNFSKLPFKFERDFELCQAAASVGLDLNSLLKQIKRKNAKAMLQFFRLKNVVDGAAAEMFPGLFWEVINLWSDKELSKFISSLDDIEEREFTDLLFECSIVNPWVYYELYYPQTLVLITMYFIEPIQVDLENLKKDD
jgi:hypothetical protein